MTTPSAPIQPSLRRPRGRQAPARRPAAAMLLVDETHRFKALPGVPNVDATTYEQMWQQLRQLPLVGYGTLCCGSQRISIPATI